MTDEYAFDLYPRSDPRDGARLVRYTYEDLIAAEYRDVIGVGSGQATIWHDHAGAEHIDSAGEQYIRVVRLGPPSEVVVGGIWTSKLPFETAVASERRHLTVQGPGQMAYLARARMAPHSYLNEVLPTFIPQDPYDGMWRLGNQGLAAGGDRLGAMVWRVIVEAQNFRSGSYTHKHVGDDDFGAVFTDSHTNDRTATKIGDLVLGFDQFNDSNGNPWTLTAGDFTAQIGESVLGVVQRLMQAGLFVWMDPDTFTLYAWEGRPAAKLGRNTDRTGGAWATGVVRFQSPTDGTVDTGNILSDANRIVNAHLPQGPIWVGGQDRFILEAGAAGALYEGFVPADTDDDTALAALGAAQSTAREEASDVGQLRHHGGNAPTTGAYRPGEHYRLDELVTINTGTGEFDYNEASYPVGAWRVSLEPGAAEWQTFAELGASFDEARERQFSIPSTPGHTHPPNPRLCPIDAGPIQMDTSWKALNIIGDSPPDGWNLAGFDDADWTNAELYPITGAYVMDMGTDDVGRLEPSDEILLRREYYLEPEDLEGADVTFRYALDNAGTIYVNGEALVTLGPDFDDTAGHYTDDHETTIPRSLFREGLNCIAIYVNNDASGSSGNTPPGATSAGVFVGIQTTFGTSTFAARCDQHKHAKDVAENNYGTVQAAIDALLGGEPSSTDHEETTRSVHGRFVAFYHRASDESPFVMYSDDGLTWRMGAEIINSVRRDPSAIHWDGKWWVVCTVGTNSFLLLSSTDLDTWTTVGTITTVGGATNSWAPEWIKHFDGTPYLDPTTGLPAITVNISTDSQTTFTVREMHPTNRAMTTWSGTTTLTGTGLPTRMIDAALYVDGDDYWLWYKEEANKRIEIAHSTTGLTSGYTVFESGDWAGWFAAKDAGANSIEGPALIRLDDGRWRVYFNENNGFDSIRAVYSETTDDWRTGTSTWTTQAVIVTETLMSHGTVLVIPGMYDHQRDPDAHPDKAADDHDHDGDYEPAGAVAAHDADPDAHGGGSGLIPVDTGAVAYDTSTPGELGITVTSDWGYDGAIAYYDDTGAAAGEEAALYWDADTGQYTVITFDF